jgi:hypothetical protein
MTKVPCQQNVSADIERTAGDQRVVDSATHNAGAGRLDS